MLYCYMKQSWVMTSKGLASTESQQRLFLVDKTYLRRTDACNHNKNNKYLNSVLFFILFLCFFSLFHMKITESVT